MDTQTHLPTAPTPLPSLTAWSETHIRDIFEAPTDGACAAALERTFAPHVAARMNGTPVARDGIAALVRAMRAGAAPAGLRVHWERASAAPHDPATNRDGDFSGFYVIRGLRRQLPGAPAPEEYERHKSVNVVIQSLSDDPTSDSRRIVSLTFVAVDVPVTDRRPRL